MVLPRQESFASLTFPTKVPSDSLGRIGSLKRTSDKSLFPMALGSCGHRITHQLRPINMNGRSILAVTSSLHILTRRASEGSEALPSLARRVRMSFFGARVIDPQVLDGAGIETAAELEEKLRRALGLLARDDLDRLCPDPRDGNSVRHGICARADVDSSSPYSVRSYNKSIFTIASIS